MVTKGKCVDLSANSHNQFFFIYLENYRDQFGESVFKYWGLKDN